MAITRRSRKWPPLVSALQALVWASAVVVCGSVVSLAAGGEGERTLAATLAVQTAMQQGREYLLQNNPKAAVEVLERQLPLVSGNRNYLALLRDAYKAYIKELRLANREDLAEVYLAHLSILDPEPGARDSAPVSAAAVPSPPRAAEAKPAAVRGYRAEVDDPAHADRDNIARELLARALEEFENRKYRQASLLFEQAHRAGQQISDAGRQRWAYCKLHRVVEQLNQQSEAYATLEKEVREALELAPRLDYGQHLLTEIDRRRRRGAAEGTRPNHLDEVSPPAAAGGTARDGTTAPDIVVRHLGRSADGWSVAETANFVIFHNQSREFAEQTARVAEQTRTAMQRRWFGSTGPNWNPKCELFLHATREDYSRATRAPGNSPGHSSFQFDGGNVLERRIDLHCDDPNLLVAVLPHETTHAVLAGNFGEQPVPRWADEGMAVLTEPREKIDRHLRNLPKHRQERQLFPLRQLMQMNDYPDPRYVGPFYAQSVSIVDFLAHEKGPQVFTQFVRDGLRGGYESALRRHYGFRDFRELEERWVRYAFVDSPRAGRDSPTKVKAAKPPP